jgi:aryl-alcohol dehydrogenase-like predicted oxidoreductase
VTDASENGMSALPVVPLGRTSVAVSRFVLGCAPLAGLYENVSEAQAEETLDAAWAAGVRAFDTAPLYGLGISERRVGAFLSTRPRHEFVVSTKVGRLLVEDLSATTPAPGFVGKAGSRCVLDYSADGVRRSLEQSLERLGLDRIDIALVHDPDDHLDDALTGAFPALIDLREQGVIGAVGAGMNNCPPLVRIIEQADVDCILVAGRYNLLDQEAGRELLPKCVEGGVGVLTAGVFGSEILVNPSPAARYRYQPASPEIRERVERIRAACVGHGVAIGAAALHFPLRHPAVTAAVVGARRGSEVAADLAYFGSAVPDQLYEDLEAADLLEQSPL